jgi:hypothetical protein
VTATTKSPRGLVGNKTAFALSSLGALAGAATAPSGSRSEGAGRGFTRGLGMDVGSGLGGTLGLVLSKKYPGLGLLAGGGAGAVAGYQAAGGLLGDPSYAGKETGEAYQAVKDVGKSVGRGLGRTVGAVGGAAGGGVAAGTLAAAISNLFRKKLDPHTYRNITSTAVSTGMLGGAAAGGYGGYKGMDHLVSPAPKTAFTLKDIPVMVPSVGGLAGGISGAIANPTGDIAHSSVRGGLQGVGAGGGAVLGGGLGGLAGGVGGSVLSAIGGRGLKRLGDFLNRAHPERATAGGQAANRLSKHLLTPAGEKQMTEGGAIAGLFGGATAGGLAGNAAGSGAANLLGLKSKTAKFIRELNKVALVSPAPQQSAIKVAIARLKQGHSLESALRAAYPGKQGAMRISLGNRIKAAAETAPAAAPAPEAPKGLLSSPGAQAGVGTAAAVYLLKRFPAVRNAILSRVIPAAKEVAAPVATGLGVGGLVGYAPTISKHLFGETPQPTQQPFLGLATKSGADDGGMSYTPGLALGGAGMAGMLGADAISKPGLLETLGRTYQGVHNANQPPQPGLTGLVNKGKDLANTAMLHRHSHIKPMLRTLGKGTGVVGAGLLGIAGLTNALKGKPQQASDPLPPTQPTPKV